ncbi:hypothetical protein ACOMHN_062444 [Nucella lapillus]
MKLCIISKALMHHGVTTDDIRHRTSIQHKKDWPQYRTLRHAAWARYGLCTGGNMGKGIAADDGDTSLLTSPASPTTLASAFGSNAKIAQAGDQIGVRRRRWDGQQFTACVAARARGQVRLEG